MRYLIVIVIVFAVGCVSSGRSRNYDPSQDSAQAVYLCPMDSATRTTPGPCPKCGITLDESHRVSSSTQPSRSTRGSC